MLRNMHCATIDGTHKSRICVSLIRHDPRGNLKHWETAQTQKHGFTETPGTVIKDQQKTTFDVSVRRFQDSVSERNTKSQVVFRDPIVLIYGIFNRIARRHTIRKEVMIDMPATFGMIGWHLWKQDYL
ncbi:hypothetical protein MAPG_00756 [Magnaporthiopsis poae ATCC 64411]|uniref:Uncharacterized protein n=1 Tax=Magnaporthiopsis poae (strain ATCC 64411 / 73-15) TaxID=644358 RepID=A0A0C4DLV8_MAGP6|nr:hypothetical protein MAPG_00756 [Magnaporthiopsis poae ATCC 64411]